jgi:hypothetical protein
MVMGVLLVGLDGVFEGFLGYFWSMLCFVGMLLGLRRRVVRKEKIGRMVRKYNIQWRIIAVGGIYVLVDNWFRDLFYNRFRYFLSRNLGF